MNRGMGLRVFLLVFIWILGFQYRAGAQKLIFIFGHVVYSAPVDTYFSHNYSSGIGVEGGIGFGASRTFLMGTIGYSTFTAFSENPYWQTQFCTRKSGYQALSPGRQTALY